MIARLLALVLCRLWLWPALERLERPHVARRPPPRIRRRSWAAVALVGSRLVGFRVELVLAPVG
jgi:hypothetical protein